jgi:NAD(P)-dependent dehydrogenase (short-subunit alcohol dehydrogenase family)
MSGFTRGPRDEVVVVTGASAGVGRAIAHAFGRRGARVALLARERKALKAAAREVEEFGGRALLLPVDVADAAAVDATAASVEEQLGPIDVWVNDAMATILAPVHETTPGEFERATNVTYLGTVYGTMAALSRMRRRDRGVIVQVGSALAYRAIPLQAAYCGAKFAIRGFTDSLRTELLHERSAIRLTMVQLPAVNTPQFDWCLTRMPGHPQPVPPIFQPEVPAEAVYWAAHHRRRELWVGHSTIKAILASYLAPSVADRYLARTGYDSQQMPCLPVPADRQANLFEPVRNVARTHGRFDDSAIARSPQLWLSEHRTPLLAGTMTAFAAAIAVRNR